MTAVLRHRGPDGTDARISRGERIGLGHQRLAIIDLSDEAAQPMRSPAGNEITYNGEIYNYLEVRAELEARGIAFRTASDTEVVLAAYEAWGPDCLSRLNGMFAFAIYDRHLDVLFAARDRFGEKPFYYSFTRDGRFVFASEIKALLAHPEMRVPVSNEAIFRFLVLREVDRDPGTFFDGIKALPAAHMLEVNGNGVVHMRPYWRLEPVTDIPNEPIEQLQEFRRLFLDSVRLRLRADVPVGTSLSGGLDSSAIVGAIAALGTSRGQHTFSARFPGSSLDEGRYIDAVVAMTGATAHAVRPDPSRIPDEWHSLAWHQESPFLSLSIYAQWCVMRLASQAGVKVLLDGQGADEVLGGYRFFMASYVKDLLRSARVGTAALTVAEHLATQGLRDAPVIGYNFLPRSVGDIVKRRVRAIGIDPGFARAHGSEPVDVPRFDGTLLNQALYVALTQSMLPPLLRYGDRNSMAFGREVRLPFLDHRLVEFAFALPNDMKLRRTRTKVVLRDALADLLPPAVGQRRDKLGYAPPHAQWLRGPLRPWIEDVMGSAAFKTRPWIDTAVTTRAWRAYLDGADRYQADILRWISLEGWARVFIDDRALMLSSHRDRCVCSRGDSALPKAG